MKETTIYAVVEDFCGDITTLGRFQSLEQAQCCALMMIDWEDFGTTPRDFSDIRDDIANGTMVGRFDITATKAIIDADGVAWGRLGEVV